MTDIFEQATRRKLRFASSVGDLTAEQLWDLPLTHKSRPSLDALAVVAAKELRDLGDFSFVDARPDPRKETLALQLEILKRIIQVKLAEAAATRAADQKKALRAELLEIKADRQKEARKGMSDEELDALIAANS